MKNIFRGCLFCSLWILSIFAGFFLLVCPILPLAVISPKRYRKWSDAVFGMWEPFPVALMEVILGIRVILTGDKINPFEGALFIMNHRTRVDWNFLWLGLFHCCQPNAHNMKYILKAPIMHLPGPGWVMQTCSFIFLHRNWAKDRPLLDRMIEYLSDSDNLYQILLFPEGTDLTGNGLKKSHKYADENNLERYYYVLHPRTTGFCFLVNKMRAGGALKAIYDITVGYPKTMPLTETDLLKGKFPEEVHFNVKRYSTSNVPYDEETLKSWLNNIWKEKETKLKKFYETGSFTNENFRIASDRSEHISDYGKVSSKNGLIKHESVGSLNVAETSTSLPFDKTGEITESSESVKPKIPENSETFKSSIVVRDHVSCEEVYRSERYRPAHLQYLVLVFWIFLIFFTLYQLFHNAYLQIWILVHSLLFTSFSFISNGFHLVSAALYLYKYGKKEE